ncbi:MAG: hypothetical protein IJK79_05425 [Bacteroidales bacterium]|nr:hypothetical protein [Bacteroidales bacterium]
MMNTYTPPAKTGQHKDTEFVCYSTQKAAILAHLRAGKSITQLQALHLYGCFRLSAVIFRLREAGFIIRTERMKIRKGTFVGCYTLIREPEL